MITLRDMGVTGNTLRDVGVTRDHIEGYRCDRCDCKDHIEGCMCDR